MSLIEEYKEISIELKKIKKGKRLEQLIFLSIASLDAILIMSLVIIFISIVYR